MPSTPRLSPLIIPLLLLAAVSGGALLLYNVDPQSQPLMPHCLVKTLTGLDCPGCGFQRAMHALLHGRVAEAAGYNLFLTLAIPYLILLILARYVLPQRWSPVRTLLQALESRPALTIYLILWCAWFVIRNWG